MGSGVTLNSETRLRFLCAHPRSVVRTPGSHVQDEEGDPDRIDRVPGLEDYMALNHTSAEFWDQRALEKELLRVFDICHGCRRCFNLCPSFDFLFKTIDRKGDEVENLGPADFEHTIDLCYQCKLCYNHCPYTPPHRWQIDFPHLMLRGRLVKARRRGIPLRDRILSHTDALGTLGCALAPLSNWANRNPIMRLVMEKTLGVHRHRNLPSFHRETFAEWYARHRRPSAPSSSSGRSVALFYTCSVNYNQPEIGRAAVHVLEKNDIDVVVPKQKCCGMPFLDSGDLDSALESVAFNSRALEDLVRRGLDIVSLGPTCTLMLKQEYPALVDEDRVRTLAGHVFDICEYLMKLHEEGKLNTDFVKGMGRIAYHIPCHLRAQNIGFKSRDLMQLLPNTHVRLIEQCSAHDGTWGAKKEYYHLSLKWAEKLFTQVNEGPVDRVVSDCPLAGLQIAQGTQQKPVHPIQIVAEAYGFQEHSGR